MEQKSAEGGRNRVCLALSLSKAENESVSLPSYEPIILDDHILDLKPYIASSALLIIQLHSATYNVQSAFFSSINAGI